MEVVEHKKRDRAGEVYGQYTIIGPTENHREWLARCSCGRVRTVKNDNIWKLTSCKSCAAKKRNKKPKKDKFEEMKNWLKPKRPKFDSTAFYKIEDRDRFYQQIVGKLINEYRNTASFEIINYHEVDSKELKKWNHRISVKKGKVTKIG